MGRRISELTYKIVAFERLNTQESINWAKEMMALGYDNSALVKLSKLDTSIQYDEMMQCLKEAIKELGLEIKRGNEAVLSYASYHIHQISRGVNVRENLSTLCNFCKSKGYNDLIYDFYLLCFAWDHLDYEDGKYNHYWQEANRENIEQIVKEEAHKWIGRYEGQYAQLSA